MAKRGNGEGTVWHNKARGRWEARVTIGVDPEGKPKRRYFLGQTRREAVDKMKEALSQIEQGVVPVDRTTTVEVFLRQWLMDDLPGSVAPATEDNYRRVVKLYILPHLGGVQLGKLTPNHVSAMLRALEDQGVSPNTRRLARSVLRRALRRAQQDGVLARNVAAIADGVKVPHPEGRTLSVEQARTFLEYVTTTDDSPRVRRLAPVWTAMLSLGLRRGEALGLAWDDVIDVEPPVLVIRRTLRRLPGTGLVLTDTKTRGSRRSLHIPAPVLSALKAHRVRQVEERLAAGPDWVDRPLGADLVFRTELGTALDPDNFRQYTYRASEAALGDKWSPHELRHSAASILLAQGVPLKTVSETLGHSSIRITADVYGHLMAPAKQEASDAMSSALFGGIQQKS